MKFINLYIYIESYIVELSSPSKEKKKKFESRLTSTKLSARRKFEALRRSTAQADPLLSWNGSVAVRPNHTPARASSINTFHNSWFLGFGWIRPAAIFRQSENLLQKGNEGIREKILSPRSNTRCRWRGPRDHRNRFDNAADWLGDGVRVARVYFSKKCISAHQRRGGECWCRCHGSPPSDWTRQTGQTAAHFQGRCTPTRTIYRRWEEKEEEEKRTG